MLRVLMHRLPVVSRVCGAEDRRRDWPLSSALQRSFEGTYTSQMRHWLICVLIGLLPFQAGAFTPVTTLPAEGTAAAVHGSDPPCHAVDDGETPQHHAEGKVACEDCPSCDLCHLTPPLLVAAAVHVAAPPHGLPVGRPALLLGRHWPPPVEPPRV